MQKFFKYSTLVAWCCFLFYIVLVLYIVFGARRRHGVSADHFRSFLNFVPFEGKLEDYQSNFAHISRYNFYSDLIGNILLFIPLSFLLMYLFRIKTSIVIIIALLTSLTIEMTQYFFGVGVADIDDVILNSIGAIIGSLIFIVFRRNLNRYGHAHTV